MDARLHPRYNVGSSLLTGSQLMSHSRVFILSSRPLFAQGVQSLISSQSGIEVIGVASVGHDVFAQMQAAAPDVVIVEAGGEDQHRLVAQVLDAIPGIRVVGLTLEDNRIHIYLQQMRQGHGVEDLVEAIREPVDWGGPSPEALQLLVIFQGRYGQRILENISRFAPESWTVEAWRVPSALPLVVDDPLTFLPLHLPAAELVLSLGESTSVAQLVPDVVERAGARAVIAPVDNVAWMQDGLVGQLCAWLRDMGVVGFFPKPFCSLTEHRYSVRQDGVSYENPWIGEFARRFGRPVFQITCDAVDRGRRTQIVQAGARRDAPCGCARVVARQLVGVDLP